jgi:hypothetical protein
MQGEAIAFFSNPIYRVTSSSEGELEVDLTFPAGWEGFNHLQVVTWRQENPESLLDQMALSNLVHPVNTSQPGDSITLALSRNAPYWPEAVHYYVIVRAVSAGGGQPGDTAVIEAAGSSFIAGLTINRWDGDSEYDEYLQGQLSWIESEVLIVDAPEFPGASSPVGAYVTLGRIPGFEVLPPMTGEPLYSDL